MLSGKPQHGSGKTKFNREKKKGESWVKLRDDAIKNGNWVKSKERSDRKTER